METAYFYLDNNRILLFAKFNSLFEEDEFNLKIDEYNFYFNLLKNVDDKFNNGTVYTTSTNEHIMCKYVFYKYNIEIILFEKNLFLFLLIFCFAFLFIIYKFF